MGLFGMRLVESRKRPSPPSVYVEQSTPVDAKLCGEGRGDNKALHLFTAGQTAGARQVLKQSPTWVSKNIAKQHLTEDGGGVS